MQLRYNHSLIILILLLTSATFTTAFGDENSELLFLTDHSDLVVVGSVTDVGSEMEERENRRHIYTYVTLKVLSTLKGNDRDNITIKMLGGRVGNFSSWNEHFVSFKEGEEVLLFLQLSNDNFVRMTSKSSKLIVQNASEKESIQRTNPNSDTDTFIDWQSNMEPTP